MNLIKIKEKYNLKKKIFLCLLNVNFKEKVNSSFN